MLFERIKQYLHERAAAARRAEYDRGFEYATRSLIKSVPGHTDAVISDLEMDVEGARTFKDYSEFDRGTEDAVACYIKHRKFYRTSV